jgi:hypothetical protein
MSPQTPAPGRPAHSRNPTPPAILYSRYKHGEVPVHVLPCSDLLHGSRGNYEVLWDKSSDPLLRPLGVITYPSARKLLLALCNRGHTDGPGLKSPGMSFDRYFRLNPIGAQEAPIGALDLFGAPGSPKTPAPAPRRARRTRRPSPANPTKAGRWYKPSPALGAVATTLALFGVLTVHAPAQAKSTDWSPDGDPTEEVTKPESLTVWIEEDPGAVELQKPALGLLKGPSEHDGKQWAKITIAVEAPAPTLDTTLIIEAPTPEPVVDGPELGIDLAGRGHEVRKLLHAGFGLKMQARGYDPDDVLQEVYKGLLARNKGKCPWDIRKSSFGHYVHMVCDCVLKNFHRKQSRIRSHEQTGVMAPASLSGVRDAEGWCEVDAALVANSATKDIRGGSLDTDPSNEVADDMVRSSLQKYLRRCSVIAKYHGDDKEAYEFFLAERVMPLKSIGMTRAEIAAELDLPLGHISKGLAALRLGTMEWAKSQGLRV